MIDDFFLARKQNHKKEMTIASCGSETTLPRPTMKEAFKADIEIKIPIFLLKFPFLSYLALRF